MVSSAAIVISDAFFRRGGDTSYAPVVWSIGVQGVPPRPVNVGRRRRGTFTLTCFCGKPWPKTDVDFRQSALRYGRTRPPEGRGGHTPWVNVSSRHQKRLV